MVEDALDRHARDRHESVVAAVVVPGGSVHGVASDRAVRVVVQPERSIAVLIAKAADERLRLVGPQLLEDRHGVVPLLVGRQFLDAHSRWDVTRVQEYCPDTVDTIPCDCLTTDHKNHSTPARCERMDQRDVVREGYDEIADAYDEHRTEETHAGFEAPITDDFFADLDDGCHVLDAGCGGGRPVLERLDRTHDAVGLDISTSQLRLSRARAPTAALAQGDLARLPFADGVFDAVVSFYAIIHVPKTEHEQVLSEFERVLRPGGDLLVSMGAIEGWEGRNDDWLDTETAMEWSYYGPERSHEIIEAAGFEIVDERRPAVESDGFSIFRARA